MLLPSTHRHHNRRPSPGRRGSASPDPPSGRRRSDGWRSGSAAASRAGPDDHLLHCPADDPGADLRRLDRAWRRGHRAGPDSDDLDGPAQNWRIAMRGAWATRIRLFHQQGEVGRWRNHLAVWTTALAVPLFWIVRVAQYIVYPPITWLVRLPKYKEAGVGQRLAPQVQRAGRARPDLVPLLRLDDGRLVARLRDAPERRVVLVPDPVCQRQEVQPTAPSTSPMSSRDGCRRTEVWHRLPKPSNRTTSGETPATRGSGTPVPLTDQGQEVSALRSPPAPSTR